MIFLKAYQFIWTKTMMVVAIAALIGIALPQTANAQAPSPGSVPGKLDNLQDTLGPVPAPEGLDIQQQIDVLKQQFDLLKHLICSNPNTPPAVAVGCNKIVFVTSSQHTGVLAGLAGADIICNARAQEAGLPGTYLAWLSDLTASPSTRFTRSEVPYVRVDGAVVARDYADLVDTTTNLTNAITLDETGAVQSGFIWTGTQDNGTSIAPNCLNWTGVSGIGGIVGDFTRTTFGWSSDFSTLHGCLVNSNRIACFQQ
jgi:hypothetical protein